MTTLAAPDLPLLHSLPPLASKTPSASKTPPAGPPQRVPAPSAVHDALTLRSLRASLTAVLDAFGQSRLNAAVEAVAADPGALDTLFPSAGRAFGRKPLPGWAGWAVEDAARTVLLLGVAPERAAAEATLRYEQGDAAERRGVIRALPFLPVGDAVLPLVDDALRTNDIRLVGAALGPYARERLDQHRWRQGVLKCLFMGVPLGVVAGLTDRCDAELARIALGFADERRAAGRPVPDDIWLLTRYC
ncbi:EboA domain-containing protein [Streptacidiphilus sp. EB129]|uniref:EboA domain-containing protein n=1 Tax=Streptacidiphilus sp. EB129 TaxID=3156262 RepID=UPI0035185E92